MTTSDVVVLYARSFLGTPYIYAGNNRLTGLDCGGFVCEVLRSFGFVGPFEDLDCQSIYDRLSIAPGSTRFASGDEIPAASILFFKETGSKEMTHTAIALERRRMIECGGGGKVTTDVHKAAMVGAMVRERPISFRKDLVCAILPGYEV